MSYEILNREFFADTYMFKCTLSELKELTLATGVEDFQVANRALAYT